MANITNIRIRYERTESLRDYRNVRIGAEADVIIYPGELECDSMRVAKSELERFVLENIDRALEEDGQPARYSNEPRHYVAIFEDFNSAFVFKDSIHVEKLPGNWTTVYASRGHRFNYIKNHYQSACLTFSGATEEEIVASLWELLATRYAVITKVTREDPIIIVCPVAIARSVIEEKRLDMRRIKYFKDRGDAIKFILDSMPYNETYHTPKSEEELEEILRGA